MRISEKLAEVGETIRRAKGCDGEDPAAVMTDPLLHKEIQTHPQRKKKRDRERLQLQQHYQNGTCEAILPPDLRRRKKKSEEDGGAGIEEREKREH